MMYTSQMLLLLLVSVIDLCLGKESKNRKSCNLVGTAENSETN